MFATNLMQKNITYQIVKISSEISHMQSQNLFIIILQRLQSYHPIVK